MRPIKRQRKYNRKNGLRSTLPLRNKNQNPQERKKRIISIPLEESDEELEEIEENNTSEVISMSFDESRINNKINSFNIHDLIKKNSVMEKDSNGLITYTKTEYYKNNKKVITQIFLDKNHKIIKKIKNVVDESDNDNTYNSDDIISLRAYSNSSRNNIGNKSRNTSRQTNNRNNNDNQLNNNNNNLNNNNIQQNVNHLMNYVNNMFSPNTPTTSGNNANNNNFPLNNISPPFPLILVIPNNSNNSNNNNNTNNNTKLKHTHNYTHGNTRNDNEQSNDEDDASSESNINDKTNNVKTSLNDMESKINDMQDSMDRLQRTSDSIGNNLDRVNTVLNRFIRNNNNNSNNNNDNTNNSTGNVRLFSRLSNIRSDSDDSEDDDDYADNLGNMDSDSEEINLPENKLLDISKLQNENKKCVICIEEFKDEDLVTNLPCVHMFHTTCLKKWIKYKKICPICRLHITA